MAFLCSVKSRRGIFAGGITYKGGMDQTYLYVEKKDDFSRVPEELMKGFGQPQLAMILPLDGRKKLVNADIEKVKQALTEQGYYLQLPPPPEDLLKQHLSVMGQKTDDTNK